MARRIAQSPGFDEAEQLAWAIGSSRDAPTPADVADLTHALIDSVERHGCPEFVQALLMAGADPTARADDGSTLWRQALRLDAGRPADERCGWMLVAAMAFGPAFPSDSGLPALRSACQACVRELESLFGAQDEHFKTDPHGRSTGEFYAVLNARHDSALALLLADAAKAGAASKARGARGQARG